MLGILAHLPLKCVTKQRYAYPDKTRNISDCEKGMIHNKTGYHQTDQTDQTWQAVKRRHANLRK